MTVTPIQIMQPKYIGTINATQFTASALTIIDAVTVVNTGDASASISISIGSTGAPLSNSNLLIDARTLQAGEAYRCPELIGHILAVDDYLSATSSVADAVNIAASGREVT